MAARKRERGKEKPKLVLRAYKVDDAVIGILTDLASSLSDIVGREVSQASVLRGVVRWAGRQDYRQILEQLAPLIREEGDAGVLWGHRVGWSLPGKKKS